ncbi:MAG: RagB/SusD family nutrient uptake outer membrane protein [Tannerella sp.]|jgi:hypothetical protein|nr:RagB/SusD family nutrient uptake outer membrane protein [Tannerella sp.]
MKKDVIKYSMKGCILAIILSSYGCNDFLEYEPYGPDTSANFWKTESDLQNAVNALYAYQQIQEVTGRGHIWYECANDNMIPGRSGSSGIGDAFKNFQGSADFTRVSDIWQNMYVLIAKTNDLLRYVPDMNIAQATKDEAIGEAYFFRAYSYLWMCPWYGDNGPNGGIPIVTEENTVDNMDVARPPSVLDNYEMIISDLRKAAELLPYFSQQSPTNYGHPHKAAAWAFAARAALYASEWDAKYFDIVIEMCDKVMGLTGLDKRGLYPDFARLWRVENNFSEEYIFSIPGSGTTGGGSMYHGMGFQQDGYGYKNTWGYFQPTAELYEAYDEPDDARRDATLLVPGQHIDFVGHDIHWCVNPPSVSSPTHLTIRKFMSIYEGADCVGKTVQTSDGHNALATVIIRYADVLLMKAEALIWKNGEGNSEAKSLLNQIRKRAGLPENSNATKAELKKERRLELAHELLPSRHYDLVRWGDAKEAYSKPLHGYTVKFKTVGDDEYVFDPSEKIVVWPARNFDPAKRRLCPIPQPAIDSSDNLVQNQGY